MCECCGNDVGINDTVFICSNCEGKIPVEVKWDIKNALMSTDFSQAEMEFRREEKTRDLPFITMQELVFGAQ